MSIWLAKLGTPVLLFLQRLCLVSFFTCWAGGLSASPAAQTTGNDLIRIGLLLPERTDSLFSLEGDLLQSIEELSQKHNLFIATRQVASSDEAQAFATDLLRKNFNILITLGPRFRDIWEDMADKFPSTHFVMLDSESEPSSFTGLVFDEHTAAFIMGAQAASQAVNKRLAFVGAVDSATIRRLLLAFRAGVRLVDPEVVVEERFVSSTAQGWQDMEAAQSLLDSLLLRSFDSIFMALGPMSGELMNATAINEWLQAEPQRMLFLAGRRHLLQLPPHLLRRSVLLLKRGDLAMTHVLQLFTEKSLKPGMVDFGLNVGGVELIEGAGKAGPDIRLETEQRLRVIRQNVLSGQIKVPDYFRVF